MQEVVELSNLNKEELCDLLIEKSDIIRDYGLLSEEAKNALKSLENITYVLQSCYEEE